MWQEVAASNVVAHKASVDANARRKLAEGREDFHTLSWLLYANVMLGRFDEASRTVDLARQAAERNPGNRGVPNGYLGMRARYILETGQWQPIALASAAPAGMPGTPGMAYSDPGNAWVFIAGMSALKRGDNATAGAAETMLRTAREKIAAGGNAYAVKDVSILEKELGALMRMAAGQKDEALRLTKDAVDIELTMSPPSGPPDPMKPALELYRRAAARSQPSRRGRRGLCAVAVADAKTDPLAPRTRPCLRQNRQHDRCEPALRRVGRKPGYVADERRRAGSAEVPEGGRHG